MDIFPDLPSAMARIRMEVVGSIPALEFYNL